MEEENRNHSGLSDFSMVSAGKSASPLAATQASGN